MAISFAFEAPNDVGGKKASRHRPGCFPSVWRKFRDCHVVDR